MATKEQNAKKLFRKHATGRIKLRLIENRVGEAMADSVGGNRNGRAFWIEFKHIDNWPKRDSTRILNGKFEPGQLSNLASWSLWGIPSFVCLRVNRDFFLLRPLLNLENIIKSDFIEQAVIKSGIEEVITYLENLP